MLAIIIVPGYSIHVPNYGWPKEISGKSSGFWKLSVVFSFVLATRKISSSDQCKKKVLQLLRFTFFLICLYSFMWNNWLP